MPSLATGTWSGKSMQIHQFHQVEAGSPGFDFLVNTMRIGMISAGLVGLFWILVGQLEEEKVQRLGDRKPRKQEAASADIFVNLKEFILNNFRQEIDFH